MKWATAQTLNVGSVFSCPYCGKRWDRGGKKEGFVRAAANSHVFTCFEVDLFRHGFVRQGGMRNWKYQVVPVSESTQPHNVRRIRRAELKRMKEGNLKPIATKSVTTPEVRSEATDAK